MRPKTKIICTLGPATSSEDILETLIERGMSVARLNLSHGSIDDHSETFKRVRRISERLGIPVGLMVDVPGIKYQTEMVDGAVLHLNPGNVLELSGSDSVVTSGVVAVKPAGIWRDVTVGCTVLLDDGLIELRVLNIRDKILKCEVVRGGEVTNGRGVTVPGKSPSQSFPSRKGVQALKFAAKHQADFVAISTVTTESDVFKARRMLADFGLEACIISKIERAEALENFRSILSASDAIMVARGDLGVEIRMSKVPVTQKMLIAQSNEAGKPVITATQMLESMINASVPTRAEVTDVANAIYDGSDGIMLSGETSIGRYPVETVEVMAEVALEAAPRHVEGERGRAVRALGHRAAV